MSFRACIVGAGGLGGPLALALTAAGGAITVCDDDVVELSNLQRQVQFTTADLGRAKAAALAGELTRRGVAADRVRAVAARFTAATADELAGDADVVIDGSDDPATKLAVSDWAVAHQRRCVVAGALRWGGTVWSGAPGAACYRCLFEDVPEGAPSCADAGVVGAVVACVGGLAARAALALVAGDDGDAGSILVVDDLRAGYAPRRVSIDPRPGCRACDTSASAPAPHLGGGAATA